jgi:hypothetical protein
LDFGTLVAWSAAMKSAFWDHWETAVLGLLAEQREHLFFFG